MSDNLTGITARLTELLAEELRDTPATNFFCARDHAAYLAAKVVEALGLTRVFSACLEEDGEVLPLENPSLGEEDAEWAVDHLPDRVGSFVGTSWMTRWERDA